MDEQLYIVAAKLEPRIFGNIDIKYVSTYTVGENKMPNNMHVLFLGTHDNLHLWLQNNTWIEKYNRY
jgi:hypothetical protein